MYTRYENLARQLREMEAPSIHSGTMLPSRLSSSICYCQSRISKQELHGPLAIDRLDI